MTMTLDNYVLNLVMWSCEPKYPTWLLVIMIIEYDELFLIIHALVQKWGVIHWSKSMWDLNNEISYHILVISL
jgi:hypothetical protein